MYFFYFDESGSRDPKAERVLPTGQVEQKDHIYCLTAIGMWEGHWKRFDREVSRIKLDLLARLNRGRSIRLDLADCEIKSNWLRNAKERAEKSPFLEEIGAQERERLTACYFRQLAEQKMTVFSVVVDKRKLHGYMTSETLHKKAYELVLERIEHFMTEYHPKHNALIVMDDTSRELNRAVTMKHAFFQREGNSNLRFRHIVEYPFFTDSKLSIGIQLADLCAYSVYRAFRTEDMSYPYFAEILPHFYRRSAGTRIDGLKVFPDDSPLVALGRSAGVSQNGSSPVSSAGTGERDVGLGEPYRADQQHPTGE